MSGSKERVCIIGAGPTGMSALYHLKLLSGDSIDIKCYEKTSTWGGMWNYTWRTGTDEYGETIPSCMYQNLWTIGPKEVMEARDYPYKDHFGKELPSYVPREIYAQYMNGRWTKGKCGDLTDSVDFCHVVHKVEYREDTDDFVVIVRNLRGGKEEKEIFSHIIVAIGNFSIPNIPDFKGIETFPGRISHSKDFRHASEYTGKSVLIIGGSFSASEIALQLLKFKTTDHVVVSSRNATLDIQQIPDDIDLRLLPECIENNKVVFQDGSSASFDAIILCTGYIYHYPFLNGNLRLDFEGKKTSLYPPNLYKSTICLKGGNKKLLFIGSYDSYFNFTVWDVHATWIAKYILQQIQPLSFDEMKNDAEKWMTLANKVDNPFTVIAFMRDYAKDLCQDIEYTTEYVDKAHSIIERTVKSRMSNICGYRDECHPNLYTGKLPPAHHQNWMNCLDDSTHLYLE